MTWLDLREAVLRVVVEANQQSYGLVTVAGSRTNLHWLRTSALNPAPAGCVPSNPGVRAWHGLNW